MRGILISLVLLGLAVPVAPAAAAGARQSGGATFTTTHPGAATGADTNLDFWNPDDPAAKTPSLRSFTIKWPAGTVIDTTVPDQCTATDAELYAEGSAACPPGSRLGGGTLVSDTGSTDPSYPRYVTNIVDQFNNRDELIGVANSVGDPSIRTVTRSKIAGTTYSTTIPPFPTFSMTDPFVGFKSWRLHSDAYVRNGLAAFRTPPHCPKAGYWTVAMTFTYWDGVTQALTNRSACTKK